MRGDQLARQWRILRTIESKNHGATVAEFASQEDCSPRTIWRDLAAIQNAQLPLLFQFNPMHDSQHQRNAQLSTRDLQRETHSMTMEVGGLREVMSWVLGFGREAEVFGACPFAEGGGRGARSHCGKIYAGAYGCDGGRGGLPLVLSLFAVSFSNRG